MATWPKAIIDGLLESGCPGHNISVVVPTQATRRTLNTMGIEQVSSSPGSREFDADILVLAVKPQKVSDRITTSARETIGRYHGLVGHRGGVTSDTLAQLLGISDIGQIVRCMPNTPSLIGHGVTGVYAADATDTVKVGMICEMLEAIGDVFLA